MRSLFFTFILFMLFKNCSAQQSGPAGLSIKPVRLFYTLLNSESSVQTISIVNNTTSTKQFKLYMQDWDRDSLGAHNYLKAGDYPHSCAKWVIIDKDFLEVKPGETQEVLVKMKMPDSLEAISEMKWTMLFIQDVEEKITPSKEKGVYAAVQNITRIGVHIVQTPPSLKEKDLKMINFIKKEGVKNCYRIICQNIGKVQFDCKTYLELSSVLTGEKTTVKKDLFPLFPNQVRYIDFVLPENLIPGKYTIVAVADGGDDIPLQISEANINVE